MGRIEWYSADTDTAGVKAYIQAQSTDGSPDGDLIFATNHVSGGGTAERMRIQYDGNVGIGTSSPGAKLEVDRSTTASASATGSTTRTNSAISVAASTTTNTRAMFGIDTNTNGWVQVQNTSTNTTASFIINPIGGNVGIGASSPNTNLEISTTVDPILRLNNSTNDVTTGADIGEIQFYTNDASTNGTGVKAFVKTVAGAFGAAQGGADLVFGTAADAVGNASEKMRLDKSGNIGLGVTPSASTLATIQSTWGIFTGNNQINIAQNAYYDTVWKYTTTAGASLYFQDNGAHNWQIAASGTAGNAITFTQAMTLDASGNLLVGTTSTTAPGCVLTAVGRVQGTVSGVSTACFQNWNQATSGDNLFHQFYTEGGGGTLRGTITYNRAGGLTAYNVTSDYRAKDISGPVTGSGALIDSVPVYMGTMKGATQERPMFIAHEVPSYAHTGEKDAVDADGNPVYQQMDASALIPVMWAEIQSLRQRLSAANL
jgi:hypothetical protein